MEQVRDFAHKMVFVGIQPVVGIGDTPRVFDQGNALRHRKIALDGRYLRVIRSEVSALVARFRKQRCACGIVHAEEIGERTRGCGVFGRMRIEIDAGGFMQQGRNRVPELAALEGGLGGDTVSRIEKAFQGSEHIDSILFSENDRDVVFLHYTAPDGKNLTSTLRVSSWLLATKPAVASAAT